MELRLEALSPGMEYATVLRWLKAQGDAVQAGEPIVEVETDKVAEEIAAPASGRLAEIVGVVGDELRVGAVLAVIDEDA